MKRTLIVIVTALTLGVATACMPPHHHGGPWGPGGPGGPNCQKRHCCCGHCQNRETCPACPQKAPAAEAGAPAAKPCCPQAGQPPAK